MFFRRRRLQALLALFVIAFCLLVITNDLDRLPNEPLVQANDLSAVFAEAYRRLEREYVYPPNSELLLKGAVQSAQFEAKRRGIYPSNFLIHPLKVYELDRVLDYLESLSNLDAVAYPREEVFETAIKSMVSAVGDPYTVIMDPGGYDEYKQKLRTHYYGGIGFQVEWSRGRYEVFEVRSQSPAGENGVKPGDVLVAIGGTVLAPLAGEPLALERVTDMLRGDIGSEVYLWFSRDGKPYSRTLKRELLTSYTAYGRLVSYGDKDLPRLGWIRIESFAESTGSEVFSILQSLKAAGAEGIALDLRDNLGGYLNSAVEVASLFLPSGSPVVYLKSRNYRDVRPAISAYSFKLPLAILVNKHTASSAEVLAGALRDCKRGILLGENTFGKGSVQSLDDLPGGWGLKITTAFYFTPKRGRIEGGGLKPDIVIDTRSGRDEALVRDEVAHVCQERWKERVK